MSEETRVGVVNQLNTNDDMQQEINGVKEAIQEAETSVIDLGNKIKEVLWDRFDYLQDRISQVTDEAQFLIDLMSYGKLYEDSGMLTNTGLATMGLHGMNYNVLMNQADRYAAEVKKLNKELANDPNNTILLEQRQEWIEAQRESILNAEEEKKAIVDLIDEGIQKELQALNDLINKYKESMDSAKSLYDYQKKVKEQADNISKIQKQLSAYSGDNSEESRARVQKLTVSLDDAMEKLQETQYNRQISETKEMLSNLYDEYELILNQRLDNIDALISDMISVINACANASNVAVAENAIMTSNTVNNAIAQNTATTSGAISSAATQNSLAIGQNTLSTSNAINSAAAQNTTALNQNAIITSGAINSAANSASIQNTTALNQNAIITSGAINSAAIQNATAINQNTSTTNSSINAMSNRLGTSAVSALSSLTGMSSILTTNGVTATSIGTKVDSGFNLANSAITAAMGVVKGGDGSIRDTIISEAFKVGYTVSDELSDIWSNGGKAGQIISMYQPKDYTTLATSVNNTLSGIATNVAAMATKSGAIAKTTIQSTTTTTKTNTAAKPVTQTKTTTPKKVETPKQTGRTTEEKYGVALAIINGLQGWGAGADRKQKLEAKGFNYDEVQGIVSQMWKDGYVYSGAWVGKYYGITDLTKYAYNKFKGGGIVDYTGLAQVDGTPGKPESFLNAEDTRNFTILKDVLNKAIHNGNHGIDLFAGITGISKPSGLRNNLFGDITYQFNIPIDHVENYDDFVNKMRSDGKFERMVQSMTIDQMVGRSSLAKNKYKW